MIIMIAYLEETFKDYSVKCYIYHFTEFSIPLFDGNNSKIFAIPILFCIVVTRYPAHSAVWCKRSLWGKWQERVVIGE